MELSAGQILAHYEILGPLGAGGMGVVYRARDTRLDREVALKVLPQAMSGDEYMARFEREAKLLAALNHPNVATIYGVDHVDGVSFITLELVPGETLRDRIKQGPLPIDEAVRVAREVAAGLQAAHETGIVHRDLKPANIIIRPDGPVKILDFGLAKRTDVKDKKAVELTQQYQIVGTPGYLSPEQARGEVADQRADVWAFGCILFEVLAGKKAFGGDSVGEAIQAVFEKTPDFESLPPKTPHALRVLVSRCLSKESSDRLRDIADVRILLEGAVDRSLTMVSGPIVITKQPKHTKLLVAGLAVMVLVAAGLGALLLSRSPAPAPAPAQTRTLAMPHGSELGWRQTSAALSKLGRGSPLIAISPDGRYVAYCAKQGDESYIYLHEVGKTAPGPALPDTAKGRAPFFSPAGKRVGFLAPDNTIKHVSVDGRGAAVEVCRLTSPPPNFSACWVGDSILFATREGLRLVPVKGGDAVRITNPEDKPDEVEHMGPSLLPDGRHVVFTVALGTKSRIAMLDLETKKWNTIVPDGGSVRYVEGWLVYAQSGNLVRATFDPRNPEARGLPQPLQDRVFRTPCAGGGCAITHFDVARDGSLVYAPAPDKGTESEARWVRRGTEGRGELIVRDKGDWKHPRLGPKGDRFAVDILQDSGTKDVHVYIFDQSWLGNQTHDGMSINSAYTPEGLLSVRSTHYPIVRDVSGDGMADLFRRSPELTGILYADGWVRNQLILTHKVSGGSSLYAFKRGDKLPRLLFASKDKARFGQLSPDGKWLAYVRDVGGKPEVYLRLFDQPGEPRRITQHGGGAPVWSKDGKELFYREPDGTMFAMDLATNKRTKLFWNEYDADPAGHQHYDVTADGQRFLMIKNYYYAPDHVHVVPWSD